MSHEAVIYGCIIGFEKSDSNNYDLKNEEVINSLPKVDTWAFN